MMDSMAGTIEFGGGERWDGPQWVFNFVMSYLVTALDGEPIAEEIREIDEENVGFLNIGELDTAMRIRILTMIHESLVADGDARLPEDLPGRAGGIGQLQEVADSAGSALRSDR
ncbi:hypothetical protein [Kribbella albertanoniae]|nr:hypothetical protein [Kribbella albertanoniae]